MFTRFRGRRIPQQLHEVSTSKGGLGQWHRLLGVAVGFPTPHSRQQDYIQVSLFTVRTVLTTEEISGCRCCPTTSREAPKLEQKMNPGFCQGGLSEVSRLPQAGPEHHSGATEPVHTSQVGRNILQKLQMACAGGLEGLCPVTRPPHSAPFALSALPLVFPTSPLLKTAVP